MNTTATMKINSKAENKKGYIYIYGDIAPDGYDYWNGCVIKSETSEKYIRDRLAELKDCTELELHISSSGGNVAVAMCIYAQICAFEGAVTSYIDGLAASAATVIAMSADKVVMPSTGLMMIHNAYMKASGNAAELRKAADDLDIINSSAKTAYIEHSKGKLDFDTVSALMDNESWLTAQMCMDYGLCDEIIGKVNADKETDSDSQQHTVGAVLQSGSTSEIYDKSRNINALAAFLKAFGG